MKLNIDIMIFLPNFKTFWGVSEKNQVKLYQQKTCFLNNVFPKQPSHDNFQQLPIDGSQMKK